MTSTSQDKPDFAPIIAKELGLPLRGVAAVMALLEEGNTVPFIARYRKEMTGDLDEVQIRDIEERRTYLTDLEARRATILESIATQGKLTDALAAKIAACATKSALEDLYLPYKPKRRTRATIARERGLEPLATRILEQPDSGHAERAAMAFVNAEKGVESVADALKGARDIVAEAISERADVRTLVRDAFRHTGSLTSTTARGKAGEKSKFEQYYDFSEDVATIPSHRYLAIRRGEREGILRARIRLDTDLLDARLLRLAGHRGASPFGAELQLACVDTLKRLLGPSVETDVRVDLKERSDREAVGVFADNLRNLLLAAPLGNQPIIGIDPGLRTGCKCAVVDPTGKFLEHKTIYPSQGKHRATEAAAILRDLLARHKPFALAVGSGTGGRETEAFIRETLADPAHKPLSTKPLVVRVDESGASIYSASDIAREEFPDLDLTVRGAISIARRLQDPLAELVKLDPKTIGVGQYQHDVDQSLLKRKLSEVVESCVNRVGVEVNTASAPLLQFVAGIGPTTAKRIVAHRDKNGHFSSRKSLLKVSGLGPKTFLQAAGFLRVRGSENPLDHSAVHPERYELVAEMARDLSVAVAELVGNTVLARRITIDRYLGEDVGRPTLLDIIDELGRPGRDPRDTFDPVHFREDVSEMRDLREGMSLEGIVTNVTNFGAFVDVGVHQDGLVHISQLADRFVKDPHEVVRAGQKIRVRVLAVDLDRKRISLTAKSEPTAAQRRSEGERPEKRPEGRPARSERRGSASQPRPKRGSSSSGKPASGQSSNANLRHNPFAKLKKG